MAQPGQPLCDLRGEVPDERGDVLRGTADELVQVQQPLQLARRLRVVVDPQVRKDSRVVVARPGLDGDQRGTLPTAAVAPGGVPGEQRGQETSGRGAPAVVSHARSIASTTSASARMLPWIA